MSKIIPPPIHTTTIPILSEQQRKELREAQIRADQKEMFARWKAKRGGNRDEKPVSYERPAFNTPPYWRDCSRGWISAEEQQADQADYDARRKRAVDSKHHKAPSPHRHDRPAPQVSKQFAKPMATQAARDDRLTPQSKALLQVITARTGKGRSTDTTKTTLGKIMNRCPRSIQRYLQELIKFGYLRTQTIKSRRTGFFIGMRIWIMNSVLPFWATRNDFYEPDQWINLPHNGRISEETKESPTNNKNILKGALSPHKPPWYREYAYR